MKIEGHSVKALLDSGNVWRPAISEKLYLQLKPPIPLRDIGQHTVGTAQEGATLEVLGEPTRALTIKVPGIQRGFPFTPIVIRNLAMDVNISGPYMREHEWDQIHSRDSLSIKGVEVPLHNGHNQYRAYVASTKIIPAHSMATLELRLADKKEPSELMIIDNEPKFQETTKACAAISALTSLKDGKYTVAVVNIGDEALKIEANTHYGIATPAETDQQDINHMDQGPPKGKGPKTAKHIDAFLKAQRKAVETKKKEETEDTTDWTEDKKRKWIIDQFHLRDKKCLKDNPDNFKRAVDLLVSFFPFFSLDGSFGRTDLITHRIITEDVYPIKDRYRPVNPALEPDLRKQIDRWLEQDVIEEADSPWSSNLVAAKKKGGRIRWCVDWRKLNTVTKKDSFPMPSVFDNFNRLAGSKLFSTFDMEGAFHVIPVQEEDREKTAFATPWGSFQQKRLGFGLTNGPASYCRLVERIL